MISLCRMFIFLIFNIIIGDKKDDTKKYTEKAVERVDTNGVKYIVYEENSVDIDEDAEVSVQTLNNVKFEAFNNNDYIPSWFHPLN